ncbi:FAD-dependent oxidoreductase [Aliidongia dinghuensis]|uniref:FAD-dependent oxidoreductase n=1 Tax=Aliidongia dinghuensis TaxID=1867774 RepID=A0A8J2Z0D3_9PROT|nr:FAD-dependent oxidoreductase [Aliidongia dinghuensis]GGF44161.1 FAD-dependent oxidoreductase [Aliidongia dinghuensis]
MAPVLDQASPPQGLWAATGLAARPAEAARSDISTEVAIIGGGFCGLSAALHLAERGIEATVLEAEAAGWGASGRNGGQVIAGLKLDPREMVAKFGREQGQALHRFGAATADLVFSIVERFQIRCEAHRDGWIQAARSEPVLAAIQARAADLAHQGEAVELIGAEQIADLTGTRFFAGGMLDRRSGTVQPLSYARGLAAGAVATGARLVHGCRVTGLAREGGRWRLETSGPKANGPTVRARHVLIATNAYLGDLYPVLKTAMIVVESIQIATEPLSAALDRAVLPSRLPVSDLMDLGVYFRRDDAGRFVIGGSGSLTGRTSPALFTALARSAGVLYPALRPEHFTSRWGGKLTLTPDHLPRLVSPEPGLHVAYGCNGRGVALMTMMGKLAAARIAGDVSDDLPIATLPPARYPLHTLRLPVMMAVRRVRRLRRTFARG